MRIRVTKQTVGWTFAGLASAAFAALTVVLVSALSGCSNSGSASPGRAKNQIAQRDADDGAGQERTLRVKTVRPSREHLKRVTSPQAHVDPFEKTDIFAKASGYLLRFGQVQGQDGKMRDLD